MSTRIILVRHGETDWNAEGRIQGHLPVPLNARGIAQAEAVARRLDGIPISALYCSDLLRARQTAEAISRRSGHETRLDRRLREWDLGVLSGRLREEVEREYPHACRIYLNRVVDEPIVDGESIRARFERVTAAVSDIASRHTGERIVLVSHGGPLGDCYRRATGADIGAKTKVDLFNGSINEVHIDAGRWVLASWGGIDHLKAIGSLANWEGRRRAKSN